MSVYKGTQLIAANGNPGRDGIDGRPGADGQGVQIVSTSTELHNNIDVGGGNNPGYNTANNCSWCEVGGYQSHVSGGQAAFVHGYNCSTTSGSGVAIVGYNNHVDQAGNQGWFVEGKDNSTVTIGVGGHIEGYKNTFELPNVMSEGVHIEGTGHTAIRVGRGGHQGGINITANTPLLAMPHQGSGAGNSIIEAIGGDSRNLNGEFARILRDDGSMGLSGDICVVAYRNDGSPLTTANHGDGTYTIGEIVQALIDANIPIPRLR